MFHSWPTRQSKCTRRIVSSGRDSLARSEAEMERASIDEEINEWGHEGDANAIGAWGEQVRSVCSDSKNHAAILDEMR